MQKFGEWVSFWIGLIVAIIAAWHILGDIQKKADSLASLNLSTNPGSNKAPTDLGFQSRSNVIEAEEALKNSNSSEAISEQDEAIEKMEHLKRENPVSEAPSIPEDSSPAAIAIPPPLEIAVIDPISEMGNSLLQVPNISKDDWQIDAARDAQSLLNDNLRAPALTTKHASLPAIAEANFEQLVDDLTSLRTHSISIVATNSDPSSIWYRAWLSASQAKELEAKGDLDRARRKYEESKSCYDILISKFPQIESEHIRNGSQLLAAKLNTK